MNGLDIVRKVLEERNYDTTSCELIEKTCGSMMLNMYVDFAKRNGHPDTTRESAILTKKELFLDFYKYIEVMVNDLRK